MARIVGPVKYKGKIGDHSAYIDRNDINIVRGPTGPSSKKAKTHPHYERFRHSGSTNGMGAELGRSIREGFGTITDHCKDGALCNRLNQAIRNILKSAPHQPAKEMTLAYANHTLLESIQWNARTPLDTIFHPDHATYIHPATGVTDIIISSFKPTEELALPHDATHFRIVVGALSIRPGDKIAPSHIRQTELISSDAPLVPATHIQLRPIMENSTLVITGLGIICYGQVRRTFKALPESSFAITKTCTLESSGFLHIPSGREKRA